MQFDPNAAYPDITAAQLMSMLQQPKPRLMAGADPTLDESMEGYALQNMPSLLAPPPPPPQGQFPNYMGGTPGGEGGFPAFLDSARPELFQQQAAGLNQQASDDAYQNIDPAAFEAFLSGGAAQTPLGAPAGDPFAGYLPQEAGAGAGGGAQGMPAAGGGGSVPRGTGGGRATGSPIQGGSIQDMIAQLNTQELASLKAQGLSVDALKKQLGQLEAGEIPMDLTGLAALTDAWTGSNFAAVYKPTETVKDRKAQIERLQGAIMQGGNDLSQNEIGMLKSKLGMQMKLDENTYKQGQDKIGNNFKQQELDIARQRAAKADGEVSDYRRQQDAAKLELEWAKLNQQREKTENALAAKGEALTPGEKKADQTYGADYVAWEIKGGRAQAEKSLDQLESTRARLVNNPNASGPAYGAMPEGMRKLADPEAFAIQEQVQEVVQANLRATLGSAYTEKEGAQVLGRAYNPSLPPAENAARLARVNKQFRAVHASQNAAAAHFKQFGTLKGYTGPQATIQTLLTDSDPVAGATATRAEKIERIKAAKAAAGGAP